MIKLTMIKLLKTLTVIWVLTLIAYSIYGISVVSASDATVEQMDTNTYECFNYEIVSNQMFDLQSKLVQSKSKFKRMILTKKINKLRPSVINREVQCLGYGVTPN